MPHPTPPHPTPPMCTKTHGQIKAVLQLTHSFCGMFNTRYHVEGISHSWVPTCKVVLPRDRQHPRLCVSQACGRSTAAGENNPLFQGREGSTLEVGQLDSPWHTITPHIDPHSMIPARCFCLAFPRLCLGFTSAAWIVLFKTRASRKKLTLYHSVHSCPLFVAICG